MLSKVLITTLALCSVMFAANCTERYGKGALELKLATGSPGELGLVKALAEEFAKSNDMSLCWIKAGSGESLSLLKNKEVDLIMVHAPKGEKEALKEGWASDRSLIGSNEFYITGPKKDPALIKDSSSVVEAYSRIAAKKALFYTRADNSGTHKKELEIWKKANISPEGSWYTINKDFMLATLKKADTTGAYFMTDSSTWVAAQKELKNMKILFRGDIFLVNTYNALKQNGLETPQKNMSAKFIEFVTKGDGQKVIRSFGKELYGEAIYNDAEYAKKYDR
ncbi:Tungstate-binding protein TupA [Sulfurospirillum diekertiae]|uniref:Tungstate-binding protein TupA n=1 Tax=Sulfurospirillum diekertiae TaxID=1854492 RepID=A0A290HD85_9BACT|nr:substrate-binding domain-containing protein [Sulfurospirillum diekertiae]ATB69407.1 Tungstate-binding protein TupA [Sulfurospirillum diekertiae]